jgi:hypothetical protein
MSYKIKIISVAVAVVFCLLGLLSVLQFFRFQHLLFEVTRSRVEVPAEALKRDIERTLATGLSLQTNAQLQTMLNQVLETNPILFSVQLAEGSAARDKVFWSSERQPVASPNAPVFVQRWPIVDPIGATVAQLTVVSDKTGALTVMARARHEVLTLWAGLCLVVLALLTPILFWLLRRLDTIIASARAMLLGQPVDDKALQNSDVYQLAKRAHADNAPTQTYPSGTST